MLKSHAKKQKIRVLIVDDSAVMRKILQELLSRDSDIEVVGTAPDPIIARDKLVALRPDVMTLDIEMPRMDGISFLEKVMEFLPTRTLIISKVTQEVPSIAMRALALGAIDVIAKPSLSQDGNFADLANELISKVKTAAQTKLTRAGNTQTNLNAVQPSPRKALVSQSKDFKLLIFGASTGGTEALKVVLPQLPATGTAILIVQHISHAFTRSFADTLNRLCPCEVREAKQGDEIRPGLALIAPGNHHMEIVKKGTKFFVRLHQEPPLHGVRPAADYLMQSVAAQVGSDAVGVILTGMGKDGAAGLLAMRQAGAVTIAQDEKTSVVYGMPKAALDLGAAQKVLSLDSIGSIITSHLK